MGDDDEEQGGDVHGEDGAQQPPCLIHEELVQKKFFWILLKPSKYDFHFNVSPWIQADVGLPWANGRNLNIDKTTIGSVLWLYF